MGNKLKTLLIYPRLGWEWDTMHPDIPLGIAYIASMLRKHDKDVRIHDASFDKSIDELKQKLKDYNPDIVGIQVLSINVENTFKIAQIVKEYNKKCIVVVGGPHPTFLPEELLESQFIDIATQGEAEYTYLDLVDRLENSETLDDVKGIVFKKGSSIQVNPRREVVEDLDLLPFPAIDLTAYEKYFKQPTIEPMPAPGINIITGRGCPFNCNFCQPISKKLFGNRLRRRSPNNIIDELEILKNKYGIKSFSIVDDLFVIDDKYVKEFCDEIIRRKLKLKWRCNSRVNTVSLEKLRWMRKANCIAIIFGVESGSQRILDLMNKVITVEQTKNAFEFCKKAKISAMANILMGYPGETIESLEDTVKLIKEIKPEMVSINIASPMPGTRLYDQAKAEGRLNVKQYAEFNREFPHGIKLDDLSSEEVVKYKKKAYVEFYKTIFPRFLIHPYFLKSLIYRLYTLPMNQSLKIILRYIKTLYKGSEHIRR